MSMVVFVNNCHSHSTHGPCSALFPTFIRICYTEKWRRTSVPALEHLFNYMIQERKNMHHWILLENNVTRKLTEQMRRKKNTRNETCTFWLSLITFHRSKPADCIQSHGEDRMKKEPTAINKMKTRSEQRWKTTVFWYVICECTSNAIHSGKYEA